MVTKIVRLISGEELIAKVDLESENTPKLIVKTPMQLVPTHQGQIAIVPWCMFGASGEIAINAVHVVYVVDPDPEIRNEYAKHTSGLVIANAAPRSLLTE
jgi:hypothetical protein